MIRTMSDNTEDFYARRKRLLETRSLYVDPEFPPDGRSLTYSGALPRNLRRVQWKRAVVSLTIHVRVYMRCVDYSVLWLVKY